MPRGLNGEPIWIEDPRRVDAFYTALLTNGDDPLVLPEPKKDAEGYTKARVTWSLLRQYNLPFQSRPRVAARVKELDKEYAALRAAAAEKLNAMILENAPSTAFEPALHYFNGFQAQFDPLQWGIPPRPPMPVGMPMPMSDGHGGVYMGSLPVQIHNYHDLLGGGSGPMRPGLPWNIQEAQIRNRQASIPFSGVNKAYREWLDFRRAQESGEDSGKMDSLWNELKQRLVFLPRDVKTCLEKRRATPPAEQIGAAPASLSASKEANPVEELIAALEVTAARAQSDKPPDAPSNGVLEQNMEPFLEAWKTVESKDRIYTKGPRSEHAAFMIWQTLAEQPDCFTLFALREKAVRSALAQLPSHQGGKAQEAIPVRKTLEMALEQCAIIGDWSSFRRVLRLDSIATLLTGGEHHLWEQIGEEFEQAAGEGKSSPEAARARYAEILQLSDNAAIVTLAIRHLKELPGKDTRP